MSGEGSALYGDLRYISFCASGVPRIVEGDDNEAVNRLEAKEDTLYRAALVE